MSKWAEIEINITDTVIVKCGTCKHQIPVVYRNSGNNRHPKCQKGLLSSCALNGYTEWEYAGRGTVKKVYETL